MTLMQIYRKVKKTNRQVRPMFDEKIIREHGHKIAGQLDRLSVADNRIAGFDVHTRINCRAEASKKESWREMSADLNKLWFSFK